MLSCGILLVEIVRILAYALVNEDQTDEGRHSLCRMRMKNPEIYHYDNIVVEARSDRTEPYFLLPLHAPNHVWDATSSAHRKSYGLNWHTNEQGEMELSLGTGSPLGRAEDTVEFSSSPHGFPDDRGNLTNSARSKHMDIDSPHRISVHQDESLFLPVIQQDTVGDDSTEVVFFLVFRVIA